MSKLNLKTLDESAGSIVTAFYYKRRNKDSRFVAPSQTFDFLFMGTYPLQRRVYVWSEGIYICILFSILSNDNRTNVVVVGGMKNSSEKVPSPKFIINNLDWKFIKKDTYPETIHLTNSCVDYIAKQIKNSGGLLCSKFPDSWQLDISSKTLSDSIIINNLT